MTTTNQVLTGGTNRVTVAWSDHTNVRGAASQKVSDWFNKASDSPLDEFPNRNYFQNSVAVMNGHTLRGEAQPAMVAKVKDPVNQFWANEQKSFAELNGRGRLDSSVSHLNQSVKGLESLTPTHTLPLEAGAYLGDVTRGQIRVIVEGDHGIGQVFHYAREAVVPRAILDVVKSAQSVFHRV
ncbi:MAG: hypothetical protein H7123_03875 [Thermoleophilia bacterium]|nr:hypothetical protein [Thermoleophilia bacterium]